jgi:hypothetical protein
MKSNKQFVGTALPYRLEAFNALGEGDQMLLRQYRFPHQYSNGEMLVTSRSNNSNEWSPEYFEKWFGGFNEIIGEAFNYWLQREDKKKILTFLKQVMRADESINWTGWRILATQVNGYPVFIHQLFARKPNSHTRVYSGNQLAPNVKKI